MNAICSYIWIPLVVFVMANVGKQIADMDDMQDAKMPASHHKKSDYSDVSDHEIEV